MNPSPGKIQIRALEMCSGHMGGTLDSTPSARPLKKQNASTGFENPASNRSALRKTRSCRLAKSSICDLETMHD